MEQEIKEQAVLEQAIKDATEESLCKLMPRVLLSGASKAGKSSLINFILGTNSNGNGAKEAYVTPGTEFSDINFGWTSKDHPLIIHDCPGSERGDQALLRSTLNKFLSRRGDSADIAERVHFVWYFFDCNQNFQTGDMKYISSVFAGIPVFVILSKRDMTSKVQADAMKAHIVEKLGGLPNFKGVFQTSIRKHALGEYVRCVEPTCTGTEDDIEYVKKTKTYSCNICKLEWTSETFKNEVDDLLEATFQCLPDIKLRLAFAAAIPTPALKITASVGIITGSIGGAVAIGANPIPFSDSLLLVPLQSAMYGSLSAVWGIPPWKFPKVAVACVALQAAVSTVGLLSANLLKLVPIFGSVAGGAINGSVAGVFTGALGVAYTIALSTVWKKYHLDWANLREEDFVKEMRNTVTKERVTEIMTSLQKNMDIRNPAAAVEKALGQLS